jgi:probable rRNA maturation factor
MPEFRVEIHTSGPAWQPDETALRELFLAAWAAIPLARRAALHVCDDQAEEPWLVDLQFLSDAEIAELNQTHLAHAGPTDVLSFPMGDWDFEREGYLLGDILASYDTALREAQARGLPPVQELARYAVHGFLHLLGFDDQNADDRAEMEGYQEAAIATTNW